MIIRILLLLLITWFLPLVLGLIPVKYMRCAHRTPALLPVCGWIFMFALFQVVAIPMIIMEQSLELLVNIYNMLVLMAAVVCMIGGRQVIPELARAFRSGLPDREHAPVIIPVLVVIALQIVMMVVLAYPDGDDAYYIGTSMTALHTDTMYRYSPYFGADGPLDMRHALSPVPIFMAWLSSITGIHVRILSHIYMGPVFLIIMYCIYLSLGNCLFPRQRRNAWLFLLFVNVYYLFGNISIYTPESFAFTRTWQGKSMFPNMIIPLLFLLLIYMAKDEMDVGEWGFMFCVIMSGVFCTSTAIYTMPVLVGAGSVLLSIVKKKHSILAMAMPCLMPCVLYGLIYVLMK